MMEILDAQIHPLTVKELAHDALSPQQADSAGAQITLAAMDAVGVRGALLQWYRPSTDAYTALYPDRFAGVPYMGWPDAEPTNPTEHIAELAASGFVVGTRFVVASPPLAPDGPQVQVDPARVRLLREGAFDDYLVASQRHQLPVFVTAPGALPNIHEMLRAYPDVVFVIDHLGLIAPVRTQKPWPEIFTDIPDVLQLAQFPNVVVKFTAAPSLSSEPYPFTDLWPHLARIIDGFGVDRLMWGSDFTRCAAMHTYRESVDFVLHSDRLSDSDKQMMFAGTMRRRLGWPRDPASQGDVVQ